MDVTRLVYPFHLNEGFQKDVPMFRQISPIARPLRSTTVKLAAAVALSSMVSISQATTILSGPAGEFEKSYLEFILDHHYSGLRPTELAVGTDTVGPTESDPYPGNPPSFPPTPAKSTDPVVIDIAITSNAAQREEILIGQGFLEEWYGFTATLDVLPSGQELIDTLEAVAPGTPFDIEFLEGFSLHHISAIERSLECLDRAEHSELLNYCANIVEAQTEGVMRMRSQLQTEYGIDFNPTIPGNGASEVPEPTTLGLLTGGLAFIGGLRRRIAARR